MNMTLLQAVAEATGLDASQGAILHRSHRGHWEIHGRFPRRALTGYHSTWVVSCLPWEGRPSRLPDDTNTGIQYVPALKGVEDSDRALEIIAVHMKVADEAIIVGTINAEAREQVKEARAVARHLRDTVIALSQAAFVDGLLLQLFHDENNRPPEWLTKPGSPDDPDAVHLPSTPVNPKEVNDV